MTHYTMTGELQDPFGNDRFEIDAEWDVLFDDDLTTWADWASILEEPIDCAWVGEA